jgi:hypothetical protein
MAQALLQLSSSKHHDVAYSSSIEPILTIDFSKDATFVIVVLAIALFIFVGVVSYIFYRRLSGRKRDASSDTIIRFKNNHRKSHLILLMDDDSPPASAGPRHTQAGFHTRRNSLINLESKSFTSINISPSCSTIFGYEMNSDSSEGFIRVVLTPPTPAKRKRRESLIDYESEEDLPAYSS